MSTRLFISLFPLLITASSLAATLPSPFLVVIDPGHGGQDFGAVATGSSGKVAEKHLTLLLAEEIKSELSKRHIQSLLTRRKDEDMALEDRTAMANRVGAQLFISIHMNANSAQSRAARLATSGGIETYVLNTATDQASKRLADLENKVLRGSIAENQEQSEVGLIVKDLIINGNLSDSRAVACKVQNSLHSASAQLRRTAQKNRGVKQALFYVLLGADMPSILIEAGFVDHPEDRALIQNVSSRQKLAGSIADAITDYRKSKQTLPARALAKASSLSSCPFH